MHRLRFKLARAGTEGGQPVSVTGRSAASRCPAWCPRGGRSRSRPFASAYDDAVGVPVRCGVEYLPSDLAADGDSFDGDALRFQMLRSSDSGVDLLKVVGWRALVSRCGNTYRSVASTESRSMERKSVLRGLPWSRFLVATETRTRRIPSPRTTLSPVIVTGRSAESRTSCAVLPSKTFETPDVASADDDLSLSVRSRSTSVGNESHRGLGRDASRCLDAFHVCSGVNSRPY